MDKHRDHVAHLDTAYPEARLGIEYEGAGHRDDPAYGRDLTEHDRLPALQWVTLRITSADVFRRPDAHAAQVAHLLGDGRRERSRTRRSRARRGEEPRGRRARDGVQRRRRWRRGGAVAPRSVEPAD